MRFDKETKKEVWLALRADGELPTTPTAGTAADPYDASSPTLFVERMRSFQENTTIHLGPGVFQVPAYSPEGRSWHPKSGQRILGAGMFITTLKIVGATNHDYLNMAIRNDPFVQIEGESGPFLKSFEVADLTVDCNMREHIGKQVAIGAIHLTGRHVRLRRTRAIDFGTEREIVEGFVLGTAGAHVQLPEPFDCVIEDCVIERPSPNSWYSHSCFILFADDRAFHRHCGIRRCLVNHEYADRPVAIASITYSGTTATALTKTPHGRTTGEWVVVTGALVENPQSGLPPDYNPFNGSYQIKSVVDERRFQYGTMPIVPVGEPTGDMWLGRSLSQIIGIKTRVPTPPEPPDPDPYNPGEPGVSVTSLGGGQWEVTVITEKPHWQVPGHNVLLTNVTVGGIPSSVLNDLFGITEVVNPTKLKFIVSTNPGNPDEVQGLKPFIGRFGSNGVGVDTGVGAVAENNRVFDARFANYHDSFDSRDLMIRRDYYHGAVAGILQALEGGTTRAVESLTHDGTTAVLTTSLPHRLEAGDGIVVSGASDPLYNGGFAVKLVRTPTTLTYEMDGIPSGPSSGAPQLISRWQVGTLLAYRNIIGLRNLRELSMSNDGAPGGIGMAGNAAVPPFTFRQVVLRRNCIRKADGPGNPDRDVEIVGIGLQSCDNAIISGNVMDLTRTDAVRQFRCKAVNYFGNEYQAGFPAQGYLFYTVAPPSGQFVNDLNLDAILAALGAT